MGPIRYFFPIIKHSGEAMKLIRIQLSGTIDAYVNPDQVASIEAQGEKRTVVTLANGKILDIDESADRVALILQGVRAVPTTIQPVQP
jgi:uncharacterized protein YlzI (FlbEa/FlbD family)